MGLWSTYRDPKRIKKICQLLEIAWGRCPDQRLGQFLLNYVFGSIGRDSHIYNKEDDVIESLLEEYIIKFDAFNELSEAEKKEQEELYVKRIYKQNQNYIKKIKTKKEVFEKWNMTDHGDRPNLFEFDPKNDIVDVFVYKNPRCPYPFTITNTRNENNRWFHQGFFIDEFIRKLDVFLRKNDKLKNDLVTKLHSSI